MAKLNIVLFEPEIPANTGNIGRTCVATGTRLHLIEPLGFRLNEKAIKRAGMDYWQGLDVTTYVNYEEFLEKNKGTFYYLTRYGKKAHSEFNYTKDENIYLVFGRESTGIPKRILRNDLEHCMRIPMTDKVRALNLSNTVAIVLYEALRQQNYLDLLRDEPHKSKTFIEDSTD